MSTKSLGAAVLLSGVISAVVCYGQNPDAPARPGTGAAGARPNLSDVEKQIISETNDFRRREGRGDLKANPEMSKAARYFADFMGETDKYGHTADGREPWERAKKYGYDYCIVEENIAYQLSTAGFATRQLADRFVEGWKNSPGHRRNMLNPDVDETGVAVAHSSTSGKYYAVQMFGRPKSEAIRFSVTNRSDAEVKYAVDGKTYTLAPRYTQTHEVCSPPKLSLVPAQEGSENHEAANVLHPNSGAHFVIGQDRTGKPTIEIEPAESTRKR